VPALRVDRSPRDGVVGRVVRLDTEPRQINARLIYERAGYKPIGNFNDNPVATYFGEKHL
jgi:hypothetical protein